MNNTNFYYVSVVPKKDGEFHTAILDYGISFEKAERIVRWYIKDHGLRYKVNGKTYHALIQIHKISDTLPDGYHLLTLKEIQTV